MKKIVDNKELIKKNMLLVAGLFLAFYFSYHVISGSRSYSQYMSLKAQVQQKQHELDVATSERELMESRVRLMRPGTLSEDLLEERARELLGLKYPEELIIVSN